MSRRLTPGSTLENLRREAKRWLKALRAGDAEARARFERGHPEAPSQPTLRDVQHALAREHDLRGWTDLKRAVDAIGRSGSRQGALLSLMRAAAAGATAEVLAVLDAHPGIVNERAALEGRSGLRSALHYAGSHAATVAALLERGADPDMRDEGDDATPLHSAAERGDMAVVRLLIEHGADPNVRDGKRCSPPAGWADDAGHDDVRDQILAARIDPFQAIDFDRPDRIVDIVRQSPWLLTKRFGKAVSCAPRPEQWWPEAWQTPLVWAVVREKAGCVRALLEQGAPQIRLPDGRPLLEMARQRGRSEIVALLEQHRRIEETHEGRVRWFVKNACPDHDIRGPNAHAMARNTARRMLRDHPEIAYDSFHTALICGDIAEVARALAERPGLASEKGGPKGWEPLLYACFTRLPSHAASTDNAIALARLLLDAGADPNAYFMAGDSRYTPLVGAIGEGEEDRPAHPRRDELVRLLLERGAEPYDRQVLYNIHFHGNVLWFLELIHEHSLRLGRAADWRDAEWHMLDMGGYGTGARYLLEIAVHRNDVALAEWLLAHGANPDAAPARDARMPQRSMVEEALRLGHDAVADALLRSGATRTDTPVTGEDALVAACLRGDVERVRALAAEHPDSLRSAKVITAAARRDRTDAVALLLDLGVPIEIENERKQRPLHAAAWGNALNVAQLLIARGAEIDPREAEWGNTPLDFAVYGQLPDMIALLSRHSRDVWNLVHVGAVERTRAVLRETPEAARLVTKQGQTPLTWLPDDERAAAAIAHLFLAHGADASIRDDTGFTAADHASRRGLREAADILRAAEDT